MERNKMQFESVQTDERLVQEEEEKKWAEEEEQHNDTDEYGSNINFNNQEIEDFFGVDSKEMERLVQVSKKYLNNVSKNDCQQQKINQEDEIQMSTVKYLKPTVFEMDDLLLDKKNSENIRSIHAKFKGQLDNDSGRVGGAASTKRFTSLPFNATKQPSTASFGTASLASKFTPSARSNSSGGKRLQLRISDIIFREVDLHDLLYLTEDDDNFKPLKFRDGQEETVEIDVSDWRETLKQWNKDNMLVEGLMIKTIVGYACLYNQQKTTPTDDQENEEKKEELEKIIPTRIESISSLSQKQKYSLAKRYEDQILIGIILLHLVKPSDASFPDAFKQILPIFSKFKTPDKSEHKEREENHEDLEAQNNHLNSKQAKQQVANLILLGVAPQCRRSAIGTLLFKKVSHLIENQFRDCVLIFGQKAEQHHSTQWRSIIGFLLKNHFNVINQQSAGEAAKIAGDINNQSIFYYPIASLVRKDQYRSTNGLFAELIKVVCKNPFAQCNREKKRKFNQELKKIKQKYEKDDIYIDIQNGEDDNKNYDQTEERKQDDVFEMGGQNLNEFADNTTPLENGRNSKLKN